ncbi:MAG: class I SAM-dependent methyltransferase [Chthoniobacterales bacterium]
MLALDHTQRAAADRFLGRRSIHGYASCKIAWDPAYRELRDRILAAPRLPVLDVGCGIGLFAAYLRESGFDSDITGVDPAADKINIAQATVPDAKFLVGSVDAFDGQPGHVVVLDVLHYFDPIGREKFLKDVIARIAPGGSAWIRTTLRDGSWRYWMTQIEEVFVRSTRWIVGGEWNFPTRAEITRPFGKAGFSCKSQPMWGRTPFNSYLFEFTRPTDAQ